jgi:DNA mismatch repair protein MutL
MKIKLLDNNTINQIAAGEVIEKPASIVKELIENSIDANAKTITIRIKDGGKEYIEIEDDGDGMSPTDLELCIKRHATSKLNSNTLQNIKTLGFRGEALPSIGSVSRLEIISKTNSNTGYQIVVDYGDIKDYKKSAANQGTVVKVSNIFLKLPARYKFLKSSRAEQNSIVDSVKRLALSNPSILFNVEIDNVKYMSYGSIDGDHKEIFEWRIKEILGTDFMKNMIELRYEDPNLSIVGNIGLPSYNRSNSNNQYLLVNNRIIQDRKLSGAIRAAYGDKLPKGRFPIFVIKIKVPYDSVDVNVHPSKSEVRFIDERIIQSKLVSTIRGALNHKVNQSLNVFSQFYEKRVSQINKSQYDRQQINSQVNLSMYDLDESYTINNQKNDEILEKENLSSNAISNNINEFPLGFARAQIFKNYILAQNSEGMIIVDQHAAHERIVFEKLKESIHENAIEKQILLIPHIYACDQFDKEKLLLFKNDLDAVGIEVEEFGDEVLIRSIPSLIRDSNVNELMRDLLDLPSDEFMRRTLENRINDILSKISCYGSVRSGRVLKVDEMNALLREIEKTPNSGQCNHGRPTHIFLSQTEIEKLFERI